MTFDWYRIDIDNVYAYVLILVVIYIYNYIDIDIDTGNKIITTLISTLKCGNQCICELIDDHIEEK